jgi:hypothetical protein
LRDGSIASQGRRHRHIQPANALIEGALERAFALAASGPFHKVSDIRLQLHREGYNYELVQGPVLAKQLTEAMGQAHRREANGARTTKMSRRRSP